MGNGTVLFARMAYHVWKIYDNVLSRQKIARKVPVGEAALFQGGRDCEAEKNTKKRNSRRRVALFFARFYRSPLNGDLRVALICICDAHRDEFNDPGNINSPLAGPTDY